MVAGGFFLFVGVLVFFVHDDEAEGVNGGEDGAAGADDDAGAALADFVPFIVAFAGGEVAVEDGDERTKGAGAEAGFEAFDGLRSEGNFGDEDDAAAALGKGVGEGLEVDFGFAAAGDAVEQEAFGGGFLDLRFLICDLREGGWDRFAGFGLVLAVLDAALSPHPGPMASQASPPDGSPKRDALRASWSPSDGGEGERKSVCGFLEFVRGLWLPRRRSQWEQGGDDWIVEGGFYFIEGDDLLGVEDVVLGGEDLFAGVWVALGDFVGDGDEAFVFEMSNGGGGGLGEFEEFLQGEVRARSSRMFQTSSWRLGSLGSSPWAGRTRT